jgi:hypothetical protein
VFDVEKTAIEISVEMARMVAWLRTDRSAHSYSDSQININKPYYSLFRMYLKQPLPS